MATLQNLVDYARSTALNDTDSVTWTDAELLSHAQNGLRLILSKRPDLYFGSLANPNVTPALGDTFPIDERYYPALCNYVIAMSHAKDAEESVQANVTMFMQLAAAEM